MSMELQIFEHVKKAYMACREAQRQTILQYLEEQGYTVSRRGGMGREDYTSDGRIAPYDLRNWKWIEARKDGVYYLISLQAFDRDPNSGNFHVLMDRIGVFACSEAEERAVKTKQEKQAFNQKVANGMTVTAIDLPVTGQTLSELKAALENAAI